MDFVYEIPNSLSPEKCEEIIERFEKDDRKRRGVTASIKNTGYKVSMDLHLSTYLDTWEDIDKHLADKLSEGLKKYQEHIQEKCGVDDSRLKDVYDSGYQIQRTTKGGYYSWHHDCDFAAGRVMTFIWYLNTINPCVDGGGTAFHPSIGGGGMIKPEQGKLLLFPATWTYVHAGLPFTSDRMNKYLITGWIHTRFYDASQPKSD
jgi:Rps23 Pro-64 3,4-dihydroxylase Tpa1-like proline 4-hydroxylase